MESKEYFEKVMQDRGWMLTYVRTQISRIIKIPTCIATSWDDFEHEFGFPFGRRFSILE